MHTVPHYFCGVEMCHGLPWFPRWFPRAQKTRVSSSQGVRNVASVCLQIGYPTIASVPHSIINGYKRVLAVAVETDYTFPLAEKVTAEPCAAGGVRNSRALSQGHLAHHLV